MFYCSLSISQGEYVQIEGVEIDQQVSSLQLIKYMRNARE